VTQHFDLTGYHDGRHTTVGALTGNLAELVGAMRHDDGTLIAIAKFTDHRYVQIWADRDGVVIGEVISNLNIGDAIALTPEDELALKGLEFNEPSPRPNPNWWLQCDDDQGCLVLTSKLVKAIYQVLHQEPNNSVVVTTWEVDPHPDSDGHEARANNRVYRQEDCDQGDTI